MLRKPRKQVSTKAQKQGSTTERNIGEIRTHIGVNHYLHKSRPVEIMKIFIHLVPSCYRAIVLSLNRSYFWLACNERKFSEVTHTFETLCLLRVFCGYIQQFRFLPQRSQRDSQRPRSLYVFV